MISPAVPKGITAEVWAAIGANVVGAEWHIPERSTSGEVIGTATRGSDGGKGFLPGGKRGLIVAWPIDAYAGTSRNDPIFVCEGASDTASLLGLGLTAVGAPMAGHCGDMVAELAKDLHAVVVADADEAGRRGAAKIAERLARSCASVRVIEPPGGAKDCRDAVIAGARREEFQALAGAADSIRAPKELRGARNNWEPVPLSALGPSVPPDWILHGLIAKTTTTLFTGLWKAGKSTFLAWLLHDIEQGGGLAEARPGLRTLVISEESSMLWAHRRDQLALSDAVSTILRPFRTRPRQPEWEDLVDHVNNLIDRDGYELVVFDTLPSLWPVTDENDAALVGAALMPLHAITQAGAALVLMHHPRKGDATEAQASRGSGALPGWADTIVEMRRFDPSDATCRKRVLRAYGRFDDTPPETVYELGDAGYTKLGDRRDVSSAARAAAIDGILLNAGTPLNAEEVRAQWTEDPKPGKRAIEQLLADGVTRRRYVLSGQGVRGDPHRFALASKNSANGQTLAH